MKRLYVLYDSECPMCRRCRAWLMRQPAFVELRFIPLQSPEVTSRFPNLDHKRLREELVVVSDDGAVYRGAYAWVMCLYALREFREWSLRLATPVLMPFARRVCELVSANRLAISKLMRLERDEEIVHTLAHAPGLACTSGCTPR